MYFIKSSIIPPGAFRLILALAVVVSHISRFDIGRIAVLLFFLLSGFWVTMIWRQRFVHRRVHWFYMSRYLRIIPLYLIVLLGSLFITEGIGLQNFLLLGVASGNVDPIGTSWSLDIELQFYLIMPLIVAISTGRYSTLVFIASLLLAAGAWLAIGYHGIVTVFQYLPAFLLGVLIQANGWKPSDKLGFASLAAFAVVTVVVVATPATSVFLDKIRPDPFDRDIFAFVWMLPLIPYVVCSLHRKSSPLDRHLGNLSYPIYLIHFPMIAFFREFGSSFAWRIGGAVAAVMLSIIVYLIVDRPFEKLRLRLTEPPRSPRIREG